MTITYSNPRKSALFHDWPWGSKFKTTCSFAIEQSQTHGERAVRVVFDPKTNEPCAPKKLTFSVRQLIVDGDDGKTYILCKTIYGNISVMRSDMKFSHESIHERDERFPALMAMFAE